MAEPTPSGAEVRCALADEAATEALGRWLAECATPPLLVFLRGPLGAGKTTLCRGFLRALGHAGTVRSPTYTLCETYAVRGASCHHCDFYRLSDAGEIEFLGLRELLDERALVLVEWPEVAREVLPAADLEVVLGYVGAAREARIHAGTRRGARLLAAAAPAPRGGDFAR